MARTDLLSSLHTIVTVMFLAQLHAHDQAIAGGGGFGVGGGAAGRGGGAGAERSRVPNWAVTCALAQCNADTAQAFARLTNRVYLERLHVSRRKGDLRWFHHGSASDQVKKNGCSVLFIVRFCFLRDFFFLARRVLFSLSLSLSLTYLTSWCMDM